MAAAIDIPNLPALKSLDSHRQVIYLVSLYAAAEGVGQVRFEQRPHDWAILELKDGSWVEYLPPVDRAAAVGRTLWALTRRSGLLGMLGLGDPSGGFSVRVGPGAAIECRVARHGSDYLLSVEPGKNAVGAATELVRSHREWVQNMIDRYGAGRQAEPGAPPDPTS